MTRKGKERTGQDRIGQAMKGNESKAKERMGSKGREITLKKGTDRAWQETKGKGMNR